MFENILVRKLYLFNQNSEIIKNRYKILDEPDKQKYLDKPSYVLVETHSFYNKSNKGNNAV